MLNEPVKLTSVPLDVRRNGGDNFEVITPAEAKRRYMEIYRRNHPAPKPVVLAIPRPAKAAKPTLKLVEATKVESPQPAPFTPPGFWTKPIEDEPEVTRERDWLIIDATPKVATVIRETALHFGVTIGDLLSQRRTANIMRPRHIAMYLAKAVTLRSLPYIGSRFGDRDHTTILHAVRKVESLIEAGDAAVIADVAAIKERLGVKS